MCPYRSQDLTHQCLVVKVTRAWLEVVGIWVVGVEEAATIQVVGTIKGAGEAKMPVEDLMAYQIQPFLRIQFLAFAMNGGMTSTNTTRQSTRQLPCRLERAPKVCWQQLWKLALHFKHSQPPAGLTSVIKHVWFFHRCLHALAEKPMLNGRRLRVSAQENSVCYRSQKW